VFDPNFTFFTSTFALPLDLIKAKGETKAEATSSDEAVSGCDSWRSIAAAIISAHGAYVKQCRRYLTGNFLTALR